MAAIFENKKKSLFFGVAGITLLILGGLHLAGKGLLWTPHSIEAAPVVKFGGSGLRSAIPKDIRSELAAEADFTRVFQGDRELRRVPASSQVFREEFVFHISKKSIWVSDLNGNTDPIILFLPKIAHYIAIIWTSIGGIFIAIALLPFLKVKIMGTKRRIVKGEFSETPLTYMFARTACGIMDRPKTSFATLIIIYMLIILCGFFVWFVDPLGIYSSPRFVGLNAVKCGQTSFGRVIKPVRMIDLNPDILIFGSSTAEAGINPEPFNNSERTIYNHAVSAASIYEIHRFVQNAAVAAPNLKEIIVCLDFNCFITPGGMRPGAGFRDSALFVNPDGSKNFARDAEKLRLALDSAFVSKAWETFQLQDFDSSSSQLTPFGSRTAQSRDGATKVIGKESYYQRTEKKFFERGFFLNGGESHETRYSLSPEFEFETCIRQISKSCEKSDITLNFVLQPMHNRFLFLIDEMGLWGKLEEWKTILATISAEKNRIQCFDFSYSNDYTDENANDPLEYFWEGLHYRQQLGEIILKEILTLKDSQEAVGMNLTLPLHPTLKEQRQLFENAKEEQYKAFEEIKMLVNLRENEESSIR